MSASRWNSSGSRSPRVSTRHLHEGRAPTRPARALGREPGEVATVVEARRLPEPGVQRGHLLDDVAGTPRDVGVLRVREPTSRRDEVFEHHRVAVALRVRRTKRRGSGPGSPARGLGRSAPRPLPCPTEVTNARWCSSKGASFTKTVGGTSGAPVSATRARPVVPELRSRICAAVTSRPSAAPNHSAVRSSTSRGNTGVRLRAAY